MKTNFLLDLDEKSNSLSHTPNPIAKRLPFCLNGLGHFYANSGYFTEREELDNYLLIYTISGVGMLKYRGTECTLKAGQIAFIHCYDYQYYQTASADAWEFKWIHLNGSSCKDYFDLLNEDTLYVVSIENAFEIEKMFEALKSQILKSDTLIDIRFSMILTTIMSELLINKMNPVHSKSYREHNLLVSDVISYIKSNYSSKINHADLMKVFHMSKFHFTRIFKKYTGTSPYEYLTNYRINQSKALLKETNHTVESIAYQVGFSNVNNFIRDFKNIVGTTPLKYRMHWIS